MKKPYSDYFNIDPLYLPAVNERAMEENPELWKTFYPHKAFVGLLKDTIKVLTRKQKVSIWVEGAYGVGKSHAVLTLKKLLDADESTTREYFSENENRLSVDLQNEFLSLKSSPSERVLTVHRYGSSNIDGDDALFTAVQESVASALKDAGIDVDAIAGATLKEAMIRYLEEPTQREIFEVVVKTDQNVFDGDDVEAILNKLHTYSGGALQTLMSKLAEAGRRRKINAFRITIDELVAWLKAIVEKTPYKSILFIWDEFTEYFQKNSRALTGFQDLAEAAGSFGFYLMIVTHLSDALKEEAPAIEKVAGRFLKPKATISLPDNIAFQLVARSMRKVDDTGMRKEWEGKISSNLAQKTRGAREYLLKTLTGAKPTDEEFQGVLPLHPYAALLLKQISTAFAQNQRSMFDFIKNDHGEEIKAFQWFIRNASPYEEPRLFTVPMLWDFFYEQGRSDLAPDLRNILDYYGGVADGLDEDEQTVVKAILIMAAISQGAHNDVKAFLPSPENLQYVFEGAAIGGAGAVAIADRLCDDAKILYKKKLGNDKCFYSAYFNDVNEADLRAIREKVEARKTAELVDEPFDENDSVGSLWSKASEAEPSLALRYNFAVVTCDNFSGKAHDLLVQQNAKPNVIYGLIAIAKSRGESAKLADLIKKFYAQYGDRKNPVVVVDASGAVFDEFEEYVEHTANSILLMKTDKGESRARSKNAQAELKKWRDRILTSDAYVYDERRPKGERATSFEAAFDELKKIDKERFPLALEVSYPKISGLYAQRDLKFGVECGVERKEERVYRRLNHKLSEALKDAWNDPEYWKTQQHLPISQMKIAVNSVVDSGFQQEGRVALGDIYDVLEAAPFGLNRCSFTAFILGFLLKEYVDGSYEATDAVTSAPLDVAKLKDLVDGVMARDVGGKYKEQYIASMSEREKSFVDAAVQIFNLDRAECASIEKTCQLIRAEMQRMAFPLWTVKYLPELQDDRGEHVKKLVDLFRGLMNPSAASPELAAQGAASSVFATKIGEFCQQYPDAVGALAELATSESTSRGMKEFLKEFEGGKLIKLSDEIKDSGRYLNKLKEKFNADAANWVWNQGTAEQMIRETILEYEIVAASNAILPRQSASYSESLDAWRSTSEQIRMSYEKAQSCMLEMKEFFTLLYEIATKGDIIEEWKAKWLVELRSQGANFRTFYTNQAPYVEASCSFYFEGFEHTDEDLKAILESPRLEKAFVMDEEKYLEQFEKAVQERRATKEKERLRKVWRDKTGTDSPRQWSRGRLFPIQLFFSADEWERARDALDLANGKPGDETSVKNALDFLSDATFYKDMLDDDKLDRLFRDKILRDNSVLFPTLDDVKTVLCAKVSEEPYEWLGHPALEATLDELVLCAYNERGLKMVADKITRMDGEKVKEFLLQLLQSNPKVGVQILKD